MRGEDKGKGKGKSMGGEVMTGAIDRVIGASVGLTSIRLAVSRFC